MATSNSPEGPKRVRVWDLPLRLFHWLLVICLIGSFVTIKTGRTDIHFLFGYAALTLILFRLLWGVVGPRYARFTSFLFSPASLIASLRGGPGAPRTLGHSPTGALSVFALLFIVGLQAMSGLFTNDEISNEGPLARFVSNAFVETAGWLHHVNERVIIGLVVLHLAAIVFYRVVKRVSLVKPMIIGDKTVSAAETADVTASTPLLQPARDDASVRLWALVVLGIAAGVVWVVVNWSP